MARSVLILALIAGLTIPQAACADPVTDRIYPAPTEALTLEGLPAETTRIAVTTADGLRLEGLEVAGRPDFPLLLVLHGNASSAADTIRRFRPAIGMGYGVVAAEYRGYSANPSRPSERGLAADADAFMALARARSGDRPLWIVGHSLGAGVGLALAERSPPDVVVTIGAFTRLRDMVSGLTRAVVPDAYRNHDVVPRLTVPWYLIHGRRDGVVPSEHARILHGLAGDAGRRGASFLMLEAGHDPDGEAVARILEAVRARDGEGGPALERLPADVKLIPFGQTAPLNP